MRSALTAMAHSSQALQLVKYFCRLIFSGFLISDLSRICACHVQRMCLKSFAANIEVYTQCWCRSWLFHLIDVQWLSVAAQRNDSKSPWSKAHKALLSRGCDIMWQDVARGEVTKCCRRSELTWCPTERLRSSLGMRAPYSTSPVISRRCTNTICVLGLAQAWCVGDLDSPNPSKRRAYLSESLDCTDCTGLAQWGHVNTKRTGQGVDDESAARWTGIRKVKEALTSDILRLVPRDSPRIHSNSSSILTRYAKNC